MTMHNHASHVTGIQGGRADGETMINGHRVSTPAPAPAAAPAGGALGELRAALAQAAEQVEQLAQAQGQAYALAEQTEAGLKPIAMDSQRDEPVDAWLAVQQVRIAAEEQQTQLTAALSALTSYRAAL